MEKTEKEQQSGGISTKPDLDSESPINTAGENQTDEKSPGIDLHRIGESTSEAGRVETDNLPLSDYSETGPVVTVLATKDDFEMLLTDSSADATDVIANTDFHAFFIKDKTTSSFIDEYNEATVDLRQEDLSSPDSSSQSQTSIALFSPLAERLRHKSPHTKVLLTVKKKVPKDLCIRARKYVGRLCNHLGLSAHDRKLIAAAGEIHNLAKFQHPDHASGGFKGLGDANIRSLRFFNEQPILVGILRSMYCNLGKKDVRQPSFELVGANVLTIVDIICDTLYFEEHLTLDGLQTIRRTLGDLTGKLFLKDVAKAFIALLEEDAHKCGANEKFNRIMIYSDRMDRIYPLVGRLRNEGFQAVIDTSLESFAIACKRRRPDIILIRLHSLPADVVKTLQYLSRNGININIVPAFLLVKSTVVHRLTSLLEMGFEDIIDLDGRLDVLVLKIKKVRARCEASSKLLDKPTQQKSGTRGNLSDMNLIDLLQAMGPSQRTARITVKPDESSADPLLIYLDQGNIIFAQLGDLLGEEAIYQALGWENGTWIVEQVADEDLPEPNNHHPNEFVMMEGCRLLDENARKTDVGPEDE
jgi:DNA-binding response OmpR family regulator